jgi:hypothetical protein
VQLPATFHRGPNWKLLEKQGSEGERKGLPDQAPEEEADGEKVLVCRQCGQHITDESRRVSIDGAHRHTFANPHGHVYDICCFDSAVGCFGTGPASEEFSWFRGYSWQIVICTGCLTHLGWFFISSGGHHFFGLIEDRLADAL